MTEMVWLGPPHVFVFTPPQFSFSMRSEMSGHGNAVADALEAGLAEFSRSRWPLSGHADRFR